jgi:hypothetical protein
MMMISPNCFELETEDQLINRLVFFYFSFSRTSPRVNDLPNRKCALRVACEDPRMQRLEPSLTMPTLRVAL